MGAADRDVTLDQTQPQVSGAERTADRYRPGMVLAERYELVKLSGKGGFANVWAAHSRLLGNAVAVKIFLDRSDGATPMLREAHATAALDHPAIVRVYDVGETAYGHPFLVMELLHGRNLEEIVDEVGKLSAPRALRVLVPIAEALDVAHAHGILHRDIKLANIVLAREGDHVQPKLIDFGLAKTVMLPATSTKVSRVVGTPVYMSPEQITGDPLDARSDVWSFAVTLYELLTGELPFEGRTVAEIMHAVLHERPRLLAPDQVDPALIEMVRRGLEKKPEDRWASIRDVGLAMAAWLERQR